MKYFEWISQSLPRFQRKDELEPRKKGSRFVDQVENETGNNMEQKQPFHHLLDLLLCWSNYQQFISPLHACMHCYAYRWHNFLFCPFCYGKCWFRPHLMLTQSLIPLIQTIITILLWAASDENGNKKEKAKKNKTQTREKPLYL